jgi:hypothetical protein
MAKVLLYHPRPFLRSRRDLLLLLQRRIAGNLFWQHGHWAQKV